MSDDNAWDPVPQPKPQEARYGPGGLSMAPGARPVSDGLYTAPGGLPEAIQAVAEAFIDAIKDDHPVLRVTVTRVQSL